MVGISVKSFFSTEVLISSFVVVVWCLCPHKKYYTTTMTSEFDKALKELRQTLSGSEISKQQYNDALTAEK